MRLAKKREVNLEHNAEGHPLKLDVNSGEAKRFEVLMELHAARLWQAP
jgi:hypothetical protein